MLGRSVMFKSAWMVLSIGCTMNGIAAHTTVFLSLPCWTLLLINHYRKLSNAHDALHAWSRTRFTGPWMLCEKDVQVMGWLHR